MPVVETVNLKDADQFVEHLYPRGQTLRHWPERDNVGKWIFRGQSDSDYELIPSVLRQGEFRKIEALVDPVGNDPYVTNHTANQCLVEALVLKEFIEAADTQGLTIPEDGQTMRARLDSSIEQLRYFSRRKLFAQPSTTLFELREWPALELLTALCLAQHSGIPTRLLDWSQSSYMAAYFAASGAARKLNGSANNARLAVYCFWMHNKLHLRDDVRIISAPRAGILNLRGQEGMFTYTPIREFDTVRGLPTPVDRQIAYDDLQKMLILTLPTGEAPALLLALRNLGYHAGRAFPSFEGAAQSVKERIYSSWHWNELV